MIDRRARPVGNAYFVLFQTSAHGETEMKRNRSAETKQPTVGSFVLFQFYFTMCDGLKFK